MNTPQENAGPWFPVYYCASCNEELTRFQMMHSTVCPICGHHDNSTIVPCVKKVKRKIYKFVWGFIPVVERIETK